MYVDLTIHLADLKKKLGADSLSFKQASQAFRDHPNLRAYLDHLGVIRLCTVDVNSFVDTMDITHRTEEGGSLEIMPFIHDKGIRVYADPPIYIVGHRNFKGFGEVPLHDWKELLLDAGISPEVIEKVKWYLAKHQPIDYDQVPE